MPRVDINQLPDTSRLFVYNTSRRLTVEERDALRAGLDAFLDQWAAHGSPLTVGAELPHDHFVVIAVDDSRVGPSGCSIDASYQFLKSFTAQTGIEILDAPDVCYRDGDDIRCVTRAAFKALADAGSVDAATTVFNNTVSTLAEYRAGRWEVPARDSWHARAYRLGEPQRA
jgi:hypothetical protein